MTEDSVEFEFESARLLTALTVVEGAIAHDALISGLTHIALHERALHAYNGRVYICAPIDDIPDIHVSVLAAPLRSFAPCVPHGTRARFVGQQGRLYARFGRLRMHAPRGDFALFPIMHPNVLGVRVNSDLCAVLRALRPFVGDDASRPWVCGVRVEGGCAWATNNVVMARVECEESRDWVWPAFTLPTGTVDAILEVSRTEGAPIEMGGDENTVTVLFHSGVWVRSKLLDGAWPKPPAGVLEAVQHGVVWTDVGEELREAVNQAATFVPDARNPVLKIEDGRVRTLEGEQGAEIEGFGTLTAGAYRAEPLQSVLRVARRVGFSNFPRVPFEGVSEDGVEVRGVLMGLNV